MPQPMPKGMPIILAISRINPDPTIALAMPPPGSPTGFGTWVRNARLTDPMPLISRYTKTASKGMSTRMAERTAKVVAPRFAILRQRLRLAERYGVGLGIDPRSSTGDAPHQQARQGIHDQGDNEQRQSD